MTFTAKERDVGEPCFVVQEDTGIVIALKGNATIEQARAVAKFLSENVKSVTASNA